MKFFRSRFGGLYVFGLVLLSLFLLLRIALCIRAGANMDRSVQELAETFLVGFFFDLVTFFYLAAPAALFLILVPDPVFRSRVHRWLAMAVYFVAVYVLLFDVAAEWLFWDEFESRFNFVAVDYLIYTHELI
ncbi:MAG: LTA synthase family protein, partial [Planctomycetota bacterium]|nr:LTA synthase family protein [Planctomycetota bacterium]